jgi:hypothetical protein
LFTLNRIETSDTIKDMAWRKLIYVYETDIVATGIKFNIGDVKVETFADGRILDVASKLQGVALKGKETTFVRGSKLQTNPAHTTILLTARTKEEDIFSARKLSVESLDSIVSTLGNIYHPTMFDKRLYAGWDYSDPSLVIAEAFIYISESVHEIKPEVVETAYKNLGENEEKFSKMSKLYAQAASMQIGEEKFVKLWTTLEIFPLETAPGQPLELAKLFELLNAVSGVSKNQFYKKLKIYSEIYDRYRSEIVHTGSIGFSEIELKNATAKLEAIVRVVMRHMLGLEYEGELAQYL